MAKPAWIDEVAVVILPLIPPAFGAVLGFRYTRDQSVRDRIISAVGGFGLGVYLGAAIAEYATLGPKSTVAVCVLASMLGMEVIGVAFAVVRQFKTDPVGTFKAWWQTWWNRGSGS